MSTPTHYAAVRTFDPYMDLPGDESHYDTRADAADAAVAYAVECVEEFEGWVGAELPTGTRMTCNTVPTGAVVVLHYPAAHIAAYPDQPAFQADTFTVEPRCS